jgi:cobalt transporter subunit CbtA
MAAFRGIVFCAALVGLIAGLAVSLVQHFATTPLILRAEIYEKAAAASVVTHDHGGGAHQHASAEEAAAHVHGADAWAPREGFERSAFTVLANIVTAIGYALALAGLLALRGEKTDWRKGLLWGLAGFAAVMAAPALGLAPELPGAAAAPLFERQIWWAGTVAATALGLALIAFGRKPFAAALALCLIVAPHVIGAPQPHDAGSLVPAALSHQFTVAVTLTSLLYWALLGALSGALYPRFAA